jgi:hypothetical protein
MNLKKLFFPQIASVAKTYGECGKDFHPGLFVRIDDPNVLKFIKNVSDLAGNIEGT